MKIKRTMAHLGNLRALAKIDQERPVVDYFRLDNNRVQSMSVEAPYIFADFSKNCISKTSFEELLKLEDYAHVNEEIDAMFEGGNVNSSENRQVLHTLLRSRERNTSSGLQELQHLAKDGYNKMALLVKQLRAGIRNSSDGQAFTDIVNIGIGGSHLGPQLVSDAFRDYHSAPFNIHFLVNADASEFSRVLKSLNPKTTLFIIASKSFNTSETILNATKAKAWLEAGGISKADVRRHFVATTANMKDALDFGVSRADILPLWDWVGGRYSIWSCVGLPVALQVGMRTFSDFLAGAKEMDSHFQNASIENNLPKILALIGIWNSDCLGAASHAVVPYDDRLRFLPAYLQQLEMESNGKSVTKKGAPLDYHTAPITWGGLGSTAQHAFFQLLHQGTRLVPVDFIVALQNKKGDSQLQASQIANCFAQAETLMVGSEEISQNDPEQNLPGSKPSTTLMMDELNPMAMGSLLSLYEHKTFIQSTIWNINAFDQWGVEQGKILARAMLDDFSRQKIVRHDPSTRALIKRYFDIHK